MVGRAPVSLRLFRGRRSTGQPRRERSSVDYPCPVHLFADVPSMAIHAARPRSTMGGGRDARVVSSDAGARATGDEALVAHDEDRGDDDTHDQGDPVDP